MKRNIETAPAEIQADLLTLQTLSLALREIAQSQVPCYQQERHRALLDLNQ